MQTYEGYVVLFYVLLLLLTLARCGSLKAVPSYQGQGFRAYAKLLWKCWKTVEPANVRNCRAAVVWITNSVVLVARSIITVLWLAYNAVNLTCDAVATTLDAVLWVAYVYAVVVWLMITIPIVWAAKTLLSYAVWAAMTASWATYVVVVVLWLLFKATTVTLACELWSLTVFLLNFATAVVAVTVLVAKRVVVTVARELWSFVVFVLQFASAVIVVARFTAVSSALYLFTFTADLLTMLHASAICFMAFFIDNITKAFMNAVTSVAATILVVITQALVLLKALRILCLDRAYHARTKSAALSCLCVLLVPTKQGEWSVVRLGMEIVCKKKRTAANKDEEDDMQKATDEPLAPDRKPRFKPTNAWGVSVETRIEWICEVLSVARPMSTLLWDRCSAPLAVCLPAFLPVQAPHASRLLAVPPAYTKVILPPIITSMLKAARLAIVRAAVGVIPTLEQVVDIGVKDNEAGDETDELQLGNGVNEDVVASRGEAPQQTFAVVDRAEPQVELPVLVPLLDQDSMTRVPALPRLRAPTLLLPRQRDVQQLPMAPLRFMPATPKPMAIPQDELIDLMNVDEVNAAPELDPVSTGEDGADAQAEQPAQQGEGGQNEHPRAQEAREPRVIHHGYDYNRDADARFMEYAESAAYQTRRQEALDRIHGKK